MEDVRAVKKLVDIKKADYYKLSDEIWDNPETGLVEYKSQKILCDAIKKEGFEVTEGLANIPTSFVGVWGKGKPVIAFTAEYDALPMLSQEACSLERKTLVENGAGHGCGHNLLGVGAIAAAFVLKDYMEENNLKGTIKIFGTPSEERDAAKTFMAREGVFDGIDAGFTWHPHSINTIWECGSLANTIATFKFKGLSAHAAASPHLGRSALDACELMNVGVNYLREHVPSDVRMHYAYVDVGGNAPNVVQQNAAVYYFVRAPKMADSTAAYERVKECARGAAIMTGTQLEVVFNLALSDFVANPSLSRLMEEAIIDVGPQEFGEDDYKLAKEYIKTLSDDELKGQKNEVAGIIGLKKAEEIAEKGLMVDYIKTGANRIGLGTGSTDVGDFSYCVPTAQCLVATTAFGTPLHSWQRTAQGKTSIAKKGLDRAVATMALTAIRALKNPEILAKAKRELDEVTGGKYVSPIPKDVKIRNPKEVSWCINKIGEKIWM